MINRLLAPAVVVLFLLTGCGYSFSGAVGSPPQGIKRLDIPTVQNSTTYLNLTNNLTNGLVQEFNRSKAMQVTSSDMAEAVLAVTITAVQIEGASRARTDDASASRRVTVRVNTRLYKKEDGSTVWKNNSINSSRTYAVVDDQSTVEANLDAALLEIAKDLSQKIHDGIFEDF